MLSKCIVIEIWNAQDTLDLKRGKSLKGLK